MGRTILCNHCKSTFNETVLANKEDPNLCPVCGASLLDGEGSMENGQGGDDGLISWYYYGFIDNNGKTTYLDDEPIDLDKFGDTYFLIKEFKAPPRDKNGSSDRAKEVLRTYVPDAFSPPEKNEPEVRCPRCGSKEIQLVARKYSLLTGFATNKFDRMCVYCKKRF